MQAIKLIYLFFLILSCVQFSSGFKLILGLNEMTDFVLFEGLTDENWTKVRTPEVG